LLPLHTRPLFGGACGGTGYDGQEQAHPRLEPHGPPACPYAWYPWTAQAELQPGTQEIRARATDAPGRSQPLDGKIFWNPNGCEWTGVFKNTVTVE